MSTARETSILNALSDISQGVSIREAARKYAIPESTIRRRRLGGVNRSTAHEYRQKLLIY